MMPYNLKDAFGETPKGVKDLVARSLREEERSEPVMKKKLSLSLIAASLAALLLAGAALAVSQTGLLASWLGVYNQETGEIETDELVADAVQRLNQSVEGDALRVTLTESLYDPEGGTYSLAWHYEPLTEGDELYVVCTGPLFDGEWTDSMRGMNDPECYLTGPTDCAKTGRLPENGGTVAKLSFDVYRVKGEIEHKNVSDFEKPGMTDKEADAAFEAWLREITNQGKLNMEGDGVLTPLWWDAKPEEAQEESLVRAGLLERVDQFELTVDIGAVSLAAVKVLAEPAEFTFDNGDTLRVNGCTVTPMVATIEAEYITAERPAPSDMESGLAIFAANPKEGQSYRCNSTTDDPVQTADGRWSVACHITASPLRVAPESIKLTVGHYEGNEHEVIGTATIELIDAVE